MKRVALAGGIGAGKSAVSNRLAQLGYVVIDADDVARDVLAAGQPALAALVDAFGSAVLDEHGDLDRAFVADVVFHDATALRRLNALTHPAIGREIVRRFDDAESAAAFVALPLFTTEHRARFHLDAAWAVEAAPDVALARLVGERGMRAEDARARLAAQPTNEERRAIVDLVLENDGTLDELYARLDAALEALGVA